MEETRSQLAANGSALGVAPPLEVWRGSKVNLREAGERDPTCRREPDTSRKQFQAQSARGPQAKPQPWKAAVANVSRCQHTKWRDRTFISTHLGENCNLVCSPVFFRSQHRSRSDLPERRASQHGVVMWATDKDSHARGFNDR